MTGITAKFGTLALLTLATAFVVPDVVRAAGPFDGNWVLSATGAGGRTSQEGGGGGTACSDFRIPFQISDNRIAGKYARSNSNPTEIVASPTGSPLTGSVQPDGTFTMKWEAYDVSGKITGNTLTATWRGQCGQRSATGTRVQ
jgi:hypothetical protein